MVILNETPYLRSDCCPIEAHHKELAHRSSSWSEKPVLSRNELLTGPRRPILTVGPYLERACLRRLCLYVFKAQSLPSVDILWPLISFVVAMLLHTTLLSQDRVLTPIQKSFAHDCRFWRKCADWSDAVFTKHAGLGTRISLSGISYPLLVLLTRINYRLLTLSSYSL